jgi:hypothetical protein
MKKLKIAYVFSARFWSKDGVSSKINSQILHWRRLGHDVSGYCLTPYSRAEEDCSEYAFEKAVFNSSGVSLIDLSEMLSRFCAQDDLVAKLKDFSPDVIYLRYETYKPFIGQLYRMRFPVILEVNTIDTIENRVLAKKSVIKRLLYWYSNITRKRVFGQTAGLVTITEEIGTHKDVAKFKKDFIAIPNPVDISQRTILKTDSVKNLPKLLFIGSSNFPWFGVDKIIELARKTVGKLEFCFIGSLEIDHDSLPENVEVNGYMSGEKLSEKLTECSIAISSMALYRYGLNEAATLKVRDYILWGFPTILGHVDSAFKNHKTPEWILQLPNTPDNVTNNIDRIVDFCERQHGKIVTHAESAIFLDFKKSEESRLRFFAQIAAKANDNA